MVLVAVVADGVGVAHEVEPVHRHALAVVLARQQPVDELLVGVGSLSFDERIDLRRRRRQAGQVEVQPADERDAVGLRRRRELLALQAGEDEAVDPVRRPVASVTSGTGCFARRDVGPVGRPLGPFGDPARRMSISAGRERLVRPSSAASARSRRRT